MSTIIPRRFISRTTSRPNGESPLWTAWSVAESAQLLVLKCARVMYRTIRHLDTVIAISPMFDRIAWRIGRFSSSFAFLDPSDKFYHQHFARMLPNGHLLLFDNGNGRPATEGGLYSRGLELALDWNTMTARKIWQYRHPMAGGSSTYKYSNSQREAIRPENGNTLVLFGSDINAATLTARSPQTFTLVEADADPEAGASAVLDMQIPGAPIVYRAILVNTLFGETTCTPPVLSNASANPAVLWPLNGKFVDVEIRYSVQSICPASTTLTVSSSAPQRRRRSRMDRHRPASCAASSGPPGNWQRPGIQRRNHIHKRSRRHKQRRSGCRTARSKPLASIPERATGGQSGCSDSTTIS